MNERIKFLGECLRQERSLAAICRDFGISRRTGYKWINRYLLNGPVGLFDQSRAPRHYAGAVDKATEMRILSARERHPRRGPRKLRAWLETHYPETKWPSASTIGRILVRHGKIVWRPRRRRTPPYTEPFQACLKPNDVWSADFKGWFTTGDGRRCDPLTVTDNFSRYLLACRVLPRTTHECVRSVFEGLFREYGLPWAIRTDNGIPFASRGLGGVSRLAVWWIRLGILPERIEPGCPNQNGRHERFHRTLKDDTASPPKASALDQQQAFDYFRHEYNEDRPHEALNDVVPGKIYLASPRPYPSRLPEIVYPDHMIIRKVRPSGRIRWRGDELYISEALIGEPVAFEAIDDRTFQIYFGPLKLVAYDEEQKKFLKLTTNGRKKN